MAIPDGIERELIDQVWKRAAQTGLNAAFLELGVSVSDPLREFYSRFWGPFRSEVNGYELLDVIEQDESIVTNTRVLRQEFQFPDRYLAISAMSGHSVLIYDKLSGGVFDVDFEDGDRLLLEGKLLPRWQSWWQFAEEYFC